MVKPITKETLFMNCMELDFATKFECKFTIETGILSPELTKSFE